MPDLDTAASSAQSTFSETSPVELVAPCAKKKAVPEGPAAQTVEKVKNRNRKADRACKKAAQQKYGVRPRNLFGYLDGPRHIALAQAILDHSDEDISPEFLYAVVMLEGLNAYFNNGGKRAREGKKRVSGFEHIGLDDFGNDAGNLKENGYLRSDYDKGDEFAVQSAVNEKGEVKKSATFSDLDVATEAASAELSWRRDMFLQDADSVLGEEEAAKMTPEEIDYWTYIYFNSGVAGGRKHLEKNKSAKIRKWKKGPEGEGSGYSANARSNALVRMATMEYLRCAGIFKSEDQQCVPGKLSGE